MEYIKGMPSALLLPMMVEWVLTCEIKRKKSKNINGTVTRQMRECLMKLYCTIGELHSQKENVEKLKRQLEEMKKNMEEVQEENWNLWKKLEEMKKKINVSTTLVAQEKDKAARTPKSPAKENRKDKGNENKNGKSIGNIKRNSQPTITPLEKRGKNLGIRRELSYPLDVRKSNLMEEETLIMIENSGKRKERTSKKKKINGVNNVGKNSVEKRKEVERTIEKNKNTPEI